MGDVINPLLAGASTGLLYKSAGEKRGISGGGRAVVLYPLFFWRLQLAFSTLDFGGGFSMERVTTM